MRFRTTVLGAIASVGAVGFSASCGGAEVRRGPEPVPFHDWCSIVCDSMATRTEVACGNRLLDPGTCTETCDRGRGATLSKRTYDEANACVAYIDSLNCENLGAAIGASVLGQGEYAERCVAR